MRAGELFVNIGLTGAEGVVSAATTVKDTFKGIASTSLETKAAIAGVFYGIQQLTAASNEFGANMLRFNQNTGLSDETLQRWQYLMRHAQVSTEETQSSIDGLSESMAQLAANKGNPAGITAVANSLGPSFDVNKATHDAYYMLDQLKRYGQQFKNVTDPGLRRVALDIIQSFGVGKNFSGALIAGDLDIPVPKYAVMSHAQNKTLADMSVQWGDLGKRFSRATADLNVKFGPALLKDINILIPKLLELTHAFGNLLVKLHALRAVGTIFEGWAQLFSTVTEIIHGPEKGKPGLFPQGNAEWKNWAKYHLPGAPAPVPTTTSTTTVHAPLSVTVQGGEHHNAQDLAKHLQSIWNKNINDTFRQIPQ